MINHRKMSLVIFIFMIGLNVLLLFKNYKNHFVMSKLQSKIIRLENSNYIITNSNIEEVQKLDLEKFSINNKKLMLLTLIKDNVCGSCLINEIKYLNDINSEFSDHIKVYYEGYKNNLTSLGANFEIIEVLNLSDKFQISDHIIDNPASFVIDKNGYILSYHKAISSSPESSAKFYDKVKSIFHSVYEN